MMTTDLALIGRLGDGAVAAVSLAHLILFSGFVLGMGPISAVAPLAAQAFGARNPRMVRRALRVGLWAAILLGVPINIAQLWGKDILIAAGQAPETAALAARYLSGLAWSMIPAWCFIAIRNFMGAVNRPEPGLWVTLAAIPLNGMLAYALIHGAVRPAAARPSRRRACDHARQHWHVRGRDLDLLRRRRRSGSIACSDASGGRTGSCWAAVRDRRADLGLDACWNGACSPRRRCWSAGSERRRSPRIRSRCRSSPIMFMVPFGISLAATVRVGHAVGRRDAAATRRAGFSAIALGAAFIAAMTVLVVRVSRTPSRSCSSAAMRPRHAETATLAGSLLLIGATFFINDGMQGIAAGALRGLNDTAVPVVFAGVSFWLIGFTSAYWLAFHAGLGVFGIWIGFSLSVATFAVLLIWRFHVLTSRHYLPALA